MFHSTVALLALDTGLREARLEELQTTLRTTGVSDGARHVGEGSEMSGSGWSLLTFSRAAHVRDRATAEERITGGFAVVDGLHVS